MKAIQTVYRGIEYRSRLEARWAAFFDALGWQYTYEPFDGDGYIPDFVVHGERPFLVEVKPALSREQYREPTEKIAVGIAAHWEAPILLAGLSPIVTISEFSENSLPLCSIENIKPPLKMADGFTFVGWIGRRFGASWMYSPASLTRSRSNTSEFGVVDWINERNCSLGSGRDPRDFRFPSSNGPAQNLLDREVEALWATACNDVKWRGTPVRA